MMTPYELVQQVYYLHTNVLLDFNREDDKYKEVLVDVNQCLQELQKEEDWTWLRERVILGHVHPGNEIPEFDLPKEIYKTASMYGDCIKLYRPRHDHFHFGHDNSMFGEGLHLVRSDISPDYYGHVHCHSWDDLDEHDYIEVPYTQTGAGHQHTPRLLALRIGNTITFNRPLWPHEAGRIAVTDCIMRIKPLHICGADCPALPAECPDVEHEVFPMVPDPLYVVLKSAAYRAELDPVVPLTRLQSLQDRTQKMLSAMRDNDLGSSMRIQYDIKKPQVIFQVR